MSWAALYCLLIVGCSKAPPAPPDPVRDSFSDFVAQAEKRAEEYEEGAYRVRFGSGRGYTAATGNEPATGTVSVHIESPTQVRRILDSIPAMSYTDYDLTFAYRDGTWVFKEGTRRSRVTEAYITSGRKANEIEPEKTEAMETLGDGALKRFFLGTPTTPTATPSASATPVPASESE